MRVILNWLGNCWAATRISRIMRTNFSSGDIQANVEKLNSISLTFTQRKTACGRKKLWPRLRSATASHSSRLPAMTAPGNQTGSGNVLSWKSINVDFTKVFLAIISILTAILLKLSSPCVQSLQSCCSELRYAATKGGLCKAISLRL